MGHFFFKENTSVPSVCSVPSSVLFRMEVMDSEPKAESLTKTIRRLCLVLVPPWECHPCISEEHPDFEGIHFSTSFKTFLLVLLLYIYPQETPVPPNAGGGEGHREQGGCDSV